jgi:hypothetical protein
LSISNSVITGNAAGGLFTSGGGVANLYGASLTIAASTISLNSARSGGGVANFGNLLVRDSTLTANAAFASGGAIDSMDFSGEFSATIVGSTISGNISQGSGGGIGNAGVMSISHSTITKNQADPGYGSGVASDGDATYARTDVTHAIIAGNINSDVDSVFTPGNTFNSGGHNLIGTGNSLANFNQPGDQTGVHNPMLGNLAENGGPTKTHALLPGSPAENGGELAAAAGTNGVPVYDQRGTPYTRVSSGRIDIGAFEIQVPLDSADFDSDSDVDGADFLSWQRGFGTSGVGATRSNGNADNDADVDAMDLAIWRDAFGTHDFIASVSVAHSSVPTLTPVLVDAAMAYQAMQLQPASRPIRRFGLFRIS